LCKFNQTSGASIWISVGLTWLTQIWSPRSLASGGRTRRYTRRRRGPLLSSASASGAAAAAAAAESAMRTFFATGAVGASAGLPKDSALRHEPSSSSPATAGAAAAALAPAYPGEYDILRMPLQVFFSKFSRRKIGFIFIKHVS
jgi:hypothetical protein